MPIITFARLKCAQTNRLSWRAASQRRGRKMVAVNQLGKVRALAPLFDAIVALCILLHGYGRVQPRERDAVAAPNPPYIACGNGDNDARLRPRLAGQRQAI